MDVIMIEVVDPLFFTATVPCGTRWPGMRHSNDVRVVIDRAMDHLLTCPDCATSDEIRGRATDGPPHITCVEVTGHAAIARGDREWMCGEDCPRFCGAEADTPGYTCKLPKDHEGRHALGNGWQFDGASEKEEAIDRAYADGSIFSGGRPPLDTPPCFSLPPDGPERFSQDHHDA